MPLIYDMPWRLTGGQGVHFKECGIHNGTRGRVEEKTLSVEWEKASAKMRDSSKTSRLLDPPWQCGVCKEIKTGADIMGKVNETPWEWENLFLRRVLAPGPYYTGSTHNNLHIT